MSSLNPFLNTNNNTSIFGNNNNNKTSNIFSSNFSFGIKNDNNNNKATSTLFGNANNVTFGTNNNNNSTLSSLQTNNIFNNNNSIFGNTSSNQNNIFINNNQNNLTTNNIFANKNNNNNSLLFQNNNNNQNNIIGNNTINIGNINNNNLFNLSGINNDNNNIINNNVMNNGYININDQKAENEINEYKQVLNDINKCMNVSECENMFKDYLYMKIQKGKILNDINNYKPYTYRNNQQIINDYNIWVEGNKHNKYPNEFFPVQISSPKELLKRNILLEKAILNNIARDHDSIKNLENVNKKITDVMNQKLIDLKNYQYKIEELEYELATLKDKYNYLTGSATENLEDIKEIKENEIKINDKIKEDEIIESFGKMKRFPNENLNLSNLNNQNYVKNMNHDKINLLLDGLTEIQNMMDYIYNDNKKTLNIIMGAQKKFDEICEKHKL